MGGTTMRRWAIALVAGAAIGLSGAVSGVAQAADSDDPIKIPIHNWSSQIVGAHILGKVLNGQGFSTEFIPADSQVVYTSMCEGDIDVVHEVWQGAFGVAFEQVVGEGCVIDAATHDAKTREEWWYPAYVEEQCPGLPDWQALNACAEMFSTPETAPKGRFLGGPVDWLKHDAERVAGLGMDFEVVNAGSAAAIWAELASAFERKAPIVHFNWTPNFIEAIYDGKFVEFPEYGEGCKDDPAWGPQPRHDLRLRQPEGRLSQDRRLEGHARQVADGLCHRLEDEPDQSRHRGDVQARRHRRDGSGRGGRQVARRQRSQVAVLAELA